MLSVQLGFPTRILDRAAWIAGDRRPEYEALVNRDKFHGVNEKICEPFSRSAEEP